MQCEGLRERFSERLDGELDPARRAGFDAHLNACARCAEAYRRFTEAVGEVHGLPRHPVPRGFAAEVTARLECEEDASPSVPRRWLERTVGWAAAFVLGLVLAVVYVEVRVTGVKPAPGMDVATLQHEIDELRVAVDGVGESARHDRERVATLETRYTGELAALARAAEAQSQLQNRDLGELREALEHAEQRLAAALTEQATALAAERERWRTLDDPLTSARQGIDDMRRDHAALLARIDDLSAVAGADIDTAPETDAANELVGEQAPVELPPALVMRNYGDEHRSLDPNFDHPDTIAELFTLYDSGHPHIQSLVFGVIDQHFRGPARALAARLARERAAARRGLDHLFGSDAGNDARSWSAQRAQRVELYRQFWRQLRSQRGGTPITLNDLRKLEEEQ